MSLIKPLFKRVKRDEDGSILTELALSLPLYLTLLTGLIEVGNFMLLNLKMQHTVVAVADLVTRDEEINEDTMEDIFRSVSHVMTPYDQGEKIVAIVTSISQTEDTPATIFWQRSGGGTLSKKSDFGEEGESPKLPVEMTMRDNETILATEVIYEYRPMILNFLPANTLKKRSFFRPRLGALQEIPDD